jgi:hypothetical protein
MSLNGLSKPALLRSPIFMIFWWVVVSSPAQSDVYSAQSFLNDCRKGGAGGTLCVSYVTGYLEGRIVAEAKTSSPQRYCVGNASSLEITLAYVNYLTGEENKNNVGILSKPNAFVFSDFMEQRYRC